MLVKICGLTSAKEAAFVSGCGADFAGVVLFYPKSRRNTEIDNAREILAALSKNSKSVAVMVAPTYEQAKAAQEAGFDYLQIHGEIAKEIMEDVNIPILKAFNIKDLDRWEHYAAHPKIAGCVLDAAEPGSGVIYDWNILRDLPRTDKLFLLAGGLTPENVAEAVRSVQPDGVDVSSGVEYMKTSQDDTTCAARCGKDPVRVAAFLAAAKNA